VQQQQALSCAGSNTSTGIPLTRTTAALRWRSRRATRPNRPALRVEAGKADLGVIGLAGISVLFCCCAGRTRGRQHAAHHVGMLVVGGGAVALACHPANPSAAAGRMPVPAAPAGRPWRRGVRPVTG
jgi:hypothetical protein